MITAEIAASALAMLEVDEGGLDRHDRAILDAIAGKFSGGPVGLSTLAAAVDEEPDTIEDVYEPYLLQQGLLEADPARPGRHRARLRAPRPAGPRGPAEPLLSADREQAEPAGARRTAVNGVPALAERPVGR